MSISTNKDVTPPWSEVPDSWVPDACFEFPQQDDDIRYRKKRFKHNVSEVYVKPTTIFSQKWQSHYREMSLPFGSDILEFFWALGPSISSPKKFIAEWASKSMGNIHTGFPKKSTSEGNPESIPHLSHSLDPNQTRHSYIQYLNWLYDTVKGLFLSPPIPSSTRKWKSEILSKYDTSDLAAFALLMLKMLHRTQYTFKSEGETLPLVKFKLTPNELQRLKTLANDGNVVVRACLRSCLSDQSIEISEYDATYPPIRLFITAAHYFPNQLKTDADRSIQAGVEISKDVKASMTSARALMVQRKKLSQNMQTATRWMQKLGGDLSFNLERPNNKK